MSKQNGGIIGPDNVTTGGPFGSASGVFKLGEVTDLIKDSKWPTAGPAGFQVANSCRFNDGSSDYLNRATSDPQSSSTTATYSVWIKRGTLGTDQCIWSGSYYDNNNIFQFKFLDSDKLSIYSRRGSSTKANLTTSQVFRDVSAWYHIVVAIDTTQGTEANRIKCYVNGALATVTGSYPSADENLYLDSGAGANYYIGRRGDSAEYFDGYIAEFVYVDGTQYANTNFGETNSQTGIWVPIDVSGLTFGTKGLYLDFKDSSALGNDVSGNNHDFTVNNLTSIDQSIDTCTNNFATVSPLVVIANTGQTYADGNLTFNASSTNWTATNSTIGASSGKWYAEFKVVTLASSTGYGHVGITATEGITAGNFAQYANSVGVALDYRGSGQTYLYSNGGSSVQAAGVAFAAGAIIGIAVDMDNKKFYLSQNGTYLTVGGSVGDPTSGSTGTGSLAIPAGIETFLFAVGGYSTSFKGTWNFGSPAYSISSGNADGNGFGNFEYAVPSKYLALCTNNLNA